MLNEDRSAAIEFEETNSVDVVLSKAPIMGEKVEVTGPNYLDSGEQLDSINTKGLPEAATLNSKPEKTHMRKMKVGDRVGKDVVHGIATSTMCMLGSFI